MTDKAPLLIVDDDQVVLNQLKWSLESTFEVHLASTPEDALKQMQTARPAVVTLDLVLTEAGPESGFQVLDKLLRRDPCLKVVLVTGREEQELGRRALEKGAFDYFTKPVDVEELRVLLGRAVAIRALELASLRRSMENGSRSPAVVQVQEVLAQAARVEVPVLIQGEPGTGKEAAAHRIHELSPWARKPFTALNCGVHSEAELKRQLREARGTLFLDEVDALSPAMQLELLHALPGEAREDVGLRVVAATAVDLHAAMTQGRFRKDLYYRLAVVTALLPPLRERGQDLPDLARSLLERWSREFQRGPLAFHREALAAMQRHRWPGNLRELEHRIQRATVLSQGSVIRAADLQLEDESPPQPLRRAREEAERRVIFQSLRRNCGNIARASRELEISRPTLHDLLRKFSITAADFKDGVGPHSNKEERP